jgi:hypothetical protein
MRAQFRSDVTRTEIMIKAAMTCLWFVGSVFLTYQLVRSALTGEILYMNKDGSFELIAWSRRAWQFGFTLFLFGYLWIFTTLHSLNGAFELRDLIKGVR